MTLRAHLGRGGHLTVEGQQPHVAVPDQQQWVEVDLAALPPPVEADLREAVGARHLHKADGIATSDPIPDRDRGDHGLVGRPRRPVVHDDHAATGQHRREAHAAGQGRPHRLSERAGQVDPAVPRAVRRERRLEDRDHFGLGSEGPHADGDVVSTSLDRREWLDRRGGAGGDAGAEPDQHDHEDRAQSAGREVGESHGHTLRRGRGQGQPRLSRCGQPRAEGGLGTRTGPTLRAPRGFVERTSVD